MTTLSFDNAIGRAALLTAAACVSCAPALAAQPFHAGDIVVSIYGNGAGNGRYGHNQASPIVLRELTTSGGFVSQLVLPQSNSKDAAGVAHSAISGEYLSLIHI